MKVSKMYFILCFIFPMASTSWNQTEVDKAYQHLYKIMDKYHNTFDVYLDRDAGGNRFFPTVIGNWQAIEISDNFHDDSTFDATSIRIGYPTIPVDITDWAGVNWLFPDTNWGNWAGQNLSGASRLSISVRGEQGGEKVEFVLGGTNRQPNNVPGRNSMDSADLLSTGIVTLSREWQEYTIDLTDTSYFAVYLDGDAGSNNRYFPSGWMNGIFNMKVDPFWTKMPHSGSSCIKVEWNGMTGADGYKWNAVMFQYPEGNWDEFDGYNLAGATKLTFWAKTEEPGLELQFQVGDTSDSCDEVFIKDRWVKIDTIWQQYTIDLTGKDLSNVSGGFAFAFNNVHDPNPDGTIFYLDDIVFDKPLAKSLDNIINGFGCAVSRVHNPNGCTFYLDNIRYELTEARRQQRLREPHFLESYLTENSSDFDKVLRNTAFLYDNALALLAFLQGGSEEDLWRSDVLASTFVFSQQNDRDFRDFRLRNAYRSGDLIEPAEGWARLPSFWDDSAKVVHEDLFNLGSATGNLAWTMIALLHYAEARNDTASLNAAAHLGQWILNNTRADDSKHGYFGGAEAIGGGGFSNAPWKSIEHNLDAYVAFSRLFKATQDSTWYRAAQHAMKFISAMYNSEPPFFWSGTTDSIQINTGATFVEDPQTWGLMVLRDPFYIPIISTVLDSCSLVHHGFDGIDFNSDRDGVWFEGTAHTALALLMVGDRQNYERYIGQLRRAQSSAPRTNGLGIVSACHDGISTGFDWEYFNRLHIGATAWYIFAKTNWNPYWQQYETTPLIVEEINRTPETFELYQNHPNPFNPSTRIRFSIPKADIVSLKIYSTTGQLVRTLLHKSMTAGSHEMMWNGQTDDGRNVGSGIYFVELRVGDWAGSKKLVLVR